MVGFLTSLGRNDRFNLRDGFRRGLSEAGFVEGRNMADALRKTSPIGYLLSQRIAGRKVAVIAASGGGAAVLAAKVATAETADRVRDWWRPDREGFSSPISIVRGWGNTRGASFFRLRVGGT